MTDALGPVIEELRTDAERYERDGALVDGAKLLLRIASRLEALKRESQLEIMTLSEAAKEMGKGYSTLQRAVAEGRIPNAGTKGKPRVRRCDLQGGNGRAGGPDLAGTVLRSL